MNLYSGVLSRASRIINAALLQLGSQEGNLEFSIIKGVLRAAGELAKLYTQNNSYTRAFTRFPI